MVGVRPIRIGALLDRVRTKHGQTNPKKNEKNDEKSSGPKSHP